MLRYVVLHHRATHGKTLPRGACDHFDWMFENGESLWTWATESLPSRTTAGLAPAIKLLDHRNAYLTFEGSLSDDRGVVSRVESGDFELVRSSADHYEFAVRGDRKGTISFQRMARVGDATWDWSFRPTRTDAS